MGKGSKNERKLATHYDDAGYDVYRPATVRFGENDMWGLFDLACHRDTEIVLVQAKSNRARDITEWFEKATPFEDVPGVRTAYAVRHDRQGWRVSYSDPSATNGYTWEYDGRDSDGCIGEGLVEYLRRAAQDD